MDEQLFELGSQLFEKQLQELRAKGAVLEKPLRSSKGALLNDVCFVDNELVGQAGFVVLFWPSLLAGVVLLTLVIWMQLARRMKFLAGRKA